MSKDMFDVLILGVGNCKIRRVKADNKALDYSDSKVTSIDMNPDCNPTICMELGGIGGERKLPFEDESFDEINAYDTLEHWGVQGDWKGYFREFEEYHRILRVGGQMCVLVPRGSDAFADPGHVRFFSANHFGMLNQAFYQENTDKGTSCTDYRWFWKKNFDISFYEKSDHHIAVILVKT